MQQRAINSGATLLMTVFWEMKFKFNKLFLISIEKLDE